jgi:hypothetical protein
MRGGFQAPHTYLPLRGAEGSRAQVLALMPCLCAPARRRE